MTGQKIALIDMDGTLCDYVSAINESLEKLRAPGESEVDPFLIRENPEYEYLWNRMDLIKSQVDWWANLPRFQLGFDVLKMTEELGYHNEILTQAPLNNPAALAGKQKWIAKNLREDFDVNMVRNKGRFYGRVLVDDFPKFALQWLEHRRKGLVIVPVNKYNKDFRHPQAITYDGTNKDQVREALVEAYNR